MLLTQNFVLYLVFVIKLGACVNVGHSESGYGQKSKRAVPYVGIPVPGQTVTGLDILTLYTRSCRPQSNANDILSNAINFLGGAQSDQLAQQTYGNLFYSLGEVDIAKLTGKWYKVLDSTNVHSEACGVSYIDLIYNSTYLATMSVRDYYREQNAQGEIRTAQGYVNKIGPDAGELHFYTGRSADACPYMLIKVGPLDKRQRYEYIVLTQLLKYPVMAFARDPLDFEAFYKDELKRFLEDNNFYSTLTRSYGMISMLDHKECRDAYYYHLE